MPRILVIDDDPGTIEAFEIILRRRGFSVATAESGRDGLAQAREGAPWDAILLDLRLPDLSGMDVLRHLHDEHLGSSFIVMTAFATIQSAIEATKLGAVDYIEKPVGEDDLLRAVEKGVAASTAEWPAPEIVELGEIELHSTARWAALVLSALHSPSDPRTLHEWGRLACCAKATLENRCHAALVPTKDSLDFARLLRAVFQARRLGCQPEALLDGDPRTVRRLLATSRLGERARSNGHAVLLGLREFVDDQRLITNPLALDAIKKALRRRRLH